MSGGRFVGFSDGERTVLMSALTLMLGDVLFSDEATVAFKRTTSTSILQLVNEIVAESNLPGLDDELLAKLMEKFDRIEAHDQG